ncbi:MAG: LysM domain-containing protein [Chloroflexota bacterium]|nr:LysM domain-containing protein [Chloroflexota bacterium]
MSRREIKFSVDEPLARRLAARASYLGLDLSQVIEQELSGWLGDWGLQFATYIVQPGDTLGRIASRFYADAGKAAVIAAFNAIADPNLIHVGQELRIPEAGPSEPLPKGESPYIFGLHDRGGEHFMSWAGRKGWVLCTEELGAEPNDWRGKAYTDLVDNGFGVIVRLNHGYGEKGTLPRSSHYRDFAKRCGNFVEQSTGCHIWIIGNEPNLAVERPGGPRHGEVITPDKYVEAFRTCREEIRSRSNHGDDQVLTAAVGPWNTQTTYESNPSGDWVVYFRDVLEQLEGKLDGMALHTYGRSANPAHIVSEACMDPPFDHRRKMFRTYVDFMEAIPQSLRHLPVYITETDQNIAWLDVNNGWVQEAYAEIDRWNGNITHQKIRSLILYRWERHAGDIWHIQGKSGVINDFRGALQHEYRWYH